MPVMETKEAKSFVEILYWFIIFFTIGLLLTFHKQRAHINYEQMSMGNRIFSSIIVAIITSLFLFLLNSLLRIILRKLFD